VLIALAGLFLRLVYFPYDVPLFNDSQGYFWYAIDMSILKEFPSHSLTNNGWPSFLSIIFQLMDSNNFLDYHNMQRFVGVVFSVATIFPVYLLCNRFFKKSYSLIGAALIAFEPKLLQHSLYGLPESFYIFLIATVLCLYFSNDIKKIYLSFAVAGLLTLVRYEGLLIIIPISIMFFIRFRNNKKNLKKYIICIGIFILIILPMAYVRNETMGQDGIVSHVSAGPQVWATHEEFRGSGLINAFSVATISLIKFVGWSQIPSFLIFVPLGVFFIFKKMDYKKSTIIFTIVVMLIPAFYAYSREFQEMKYLFVLYPIFCVLACFAFKIFLEKFHRKNLIFCMIVGGIILSSMVYVEWKSMDREHYLEAYEILTELAQKEMKINKELGKYGVELGFLHWAPLIDVDEFPILKKEMPPLKVTMAYQGKAESTRGWNEQLKQWNPDIDELELEKSLEYHNILIDNLGDFFQVLKKQKMTHLILDEFNSSVLINDELRLHLIDIFNHENKYPFLVKEYDSKENGFNYHIKLFKIDYKMLEEFYQKRV